MHRDELEELISEYNSSEQAWIDFKQHYPVDSEEGHEKKADFVKDICAMANSHGVEPDSTLEFLSPEQRYIIVGVEDETGGVVGTDQDIGPYTSILEEDSSTAQNILADYLTPLPDVSIQKFTDHEHALVLITIQVSDDPPVTVRNQLDDYLARGDVYVRGGDRNMPAYRPHYRQFIDYHLERMREFITEGIMEIDFSNFHSSDEIVEEPDAEDAMPVVPGEDGPEFQASLRYPVELRSLQREVNADLTKWRERPRHHCEMVGLIDYYAKYDELELSDEALAFLTQSSWKNNLNGGFWIFKLDEEWIADAVSCVRLNSIASHQRLKFAGCLAQIASIETVERIVEVSDLETTTPQSHGSRIMRYAREDHPEEVLYDTTGLSEGPPVGEMRNMDTGELEECIQEITRQIAEEVNDGKEPSNDMIKLITNLEIFLIQELQVSEAVDSDIYDALG